MKKIIALLIMVLFVAVAIGFTYEDAECKSRSYRSSSSRSSSRSYSQSYKPSKSYSSNKSYKSSNPSKSYKSSKPKKSKATKPKKSFNKSFNKKTKDKKFSNKSTNKNAKKRLAKKQERRNNRKVYKDKNGKKISAKEAERRKAQSKRDKKASRAKKDSQYKPQYTGKEYSKNYSNVTVVNNYNHVGYGFSSGYGGLFNTYMNIMLIDSIIDRERAIATMHRDPNYYQFQGELNRLSRDNAELRQQMNQIQRYENQEYYGDEGQYDEVYEEDYQEPVHLAQQTTNRPVKTVVKTNVVEKGWGVGTWIMFLVGGIIITLLGLIVWRNWGLLTQE